MKMNVAVFAVGMIASTIASVNAEEAKKGPEDNVSETGKNEIPLCNKMVPIDVGISPEFIEKSRIDELKYNDANDDAHGYGSVVVEKLHKYEVARRLEYAVTCEIERLGYVVARPFSVKASISDFSLRSSGTIISSGIVPIAGALNRENRPDRLAVMFDVFVNQGDKPYQFTVRDSTRKGGFHAAPSQRVNSMVKSVTRDVIKNFLKQGFIAEPYAIASGDPSSSMRDTIATANREVLLRITRSLSKQKEPIDVTLLDRVADRIYQSQAETDGGMADTLAHMCKLLASSKNGKYKQMLLEVAEKASHSTLRKHAARSAEQLPDGVQPYVPQKNKNNSQS